MNYEEGLLFLETKAHFEACEESDEKFCICDILLDKMEGAQEAEMQRYLQEDEGIFI